MLSAPPAQAVTSLGASWIPYLIAGVLLVVLAVMARLRARTGVAVALSEFLLVRGATLLLIAGMVGLLADAAAEGDGLTAVDRPMWSWFIGHRGAVLTAAAKTVTTVGNTAVMGAVAVVVVVALAWRRHRGEAALVAVVAAGAALIVVVTKPIVGRLRPPEEFRLVTETNQSFPSGHAVASMAILGVLAIVLIPRLAGHRWRVTATIAVVVFVALIGLSRLYLGVHWPTDVAGGWLTGFGWLLLCLTVRTLWRTYPALFPTWGRRAAARPDRSVLGSDL